MMKISYFKSRFFDKSGDKKTVIKISDIIYHPEFKSLLKMDQQVIETMTNSMKEKGFIPGHEVHIWNDNGKLFLIDGHTRLYCWAALNNTTIPAVIHKFSSLKEAKAFAIGEQVNRRNLSGIQLLEIVNSLDFFKGKGISEGEKGKASELLGKKIGVSSKTIEKARVVLKEASEEQKNAIKKNELSVNQVYQQLRGKKTKPNLNSDFSFIQGIRYALLQLQTGKTIDNLTDEINQGLDVSDCLNKLKAIHKS